MSPYDESVPPAQSLKLLKYEELDSTNDEAKRLVRAALASGEDPSALYGTAITARRQSAGRGRGGKTFASPGKGSIYVSFILELPENLAEQRITVLAGEAVCRAIGDTTRYDPKIKGVNDVTIDGLKVCGILAESIPHAVVLGIGININLDESDFPADLKGIAGTLILNKEKRGRLFQALLQIPFGLHALAQ